MKFTIIPDDKTIIINGFGYSELEFIIDANIHAVQWYDDIGEIEYKSELTENGLNKPQNLIIHQYSDFTLALNAWESAKQNELAQQVEVNNGN
jgi:hypothetical protein